MQVLKNATSKDYDSTIPSREDDTIIIVLVQR
jgi:hypothetical protein